MFKLPDLPYTVDALEPHIDSLTVKIHHDNHHQKYLDNLNAIVDKEPTLQDRTIEDILSDTESIKEDVRQGVVNNGGGYLNHNIYLECMSPKSVFNEESEIGKEIIKVFSSLDSFKEKFTNAALGRFGSGWVWLVLNNGELEIIDTQNQDTPISIGKIPLLCIDVWEHAYYLKYQYKRADYIADWWSVVNWDKVNSNFNQAK